MNQSESCFSDPPLGKPSLVPYTLRLGVTGHRTLQDESAVKGTVGATFKQLRHVLESTAACHSYPLALGHGSWRRMENLLIWNGKRMLTKLGLLTSCTSLQTDQILRWCVVSGLAEGADCIVARLAMTELHADLEAVLPFDADEFRKDFGTPSALSEFDALLNKAHRLVCTDDSAISHTPVRPAGYRHVGERIVNTCEILLAIWDGQSARGEGGTADVVSYALSLNRLVIWIHASDTSKLPCLVCKVDKDGRPVRTAPLPTLATGWSPNFVQLVEYNRDPAFRLEAFNRPLKENWHRLLRAAKAAGLPLQHVLPVLELILPHYARADQLAIHYQHWHTRAATRLYRLAAIAVAIAVLQALFAPHSTNWILLEILALVLAVSWYRLSICEIWQEKWLHYRHLSERFRTLIFTSLVKPDYTKNTSRDEHPLPFYPGPGGWVLGAFDAVAQQLPNLALKPCDTAALRNFLLAGWIVDQAKFHEGIAVRRQKAAHREHLIIGWMLAVTLIAACLHVLNMATCPFLEHLITALAIILPAFASAQHAIGGIHDYERMAIRSVGMVEILKGLERSIGDTSNEETLRREIDRAQTIMSAENYEWCVSLSFRRLSLPV